MIRRRAARGLYALALGLIGFSVYLLLLSERLRK